MATKRKNQSVITNFFAGKTNTNEGQAQNPSSTPIPGSADLDLEEQQPQKKSKGKHHYGYKSEWEATFPWLEPGFPGWSGMFCKLCELHKISNRQNKCKVWSEIPNRSHRKTDA